jgi:hypothetical protein
MLSKVVTFLSLLSIVNYVQSEELQGPPAPRLGTVTSRQQQQYCKWTPSQSGWPTREEWQQLKNQVKGRLLKPNPPAAACHRSYAEYNNDNCESVLKGFRDSSWHSDHPTSNMWQNLNNYSCMPGRSGTCSTSGYPVYVVDAREPMDVKAAVDFARKKNIRLNIKSTGHDFLGRQAD